MYLLLGSLLLSCPLQAIQHFALPHLICLRWLLCSLQLRTFRFLGVLSLPHCVLVLTLRSLCTTSMSLMTHLSTSHGSLPACLLSSRLLLLRSFRVLPSSLVSQVRSLTIRTPQINTCLLWLLMAHLMTWLTCLTCCGKNTTFIPG